MKGEKMLSAALAIVLITGVFAASLVDIESHTYAVESDFNVTFASLKEGQIATIEEMQAPLTAAAPIPPQILRPVASGRDVRGNARAEVDVSNMRDGYVMVRYLAGGGTLIKVLITGPGNVRYTYTLRNDGQWEVFPLSDGNGTYTIGVFRNVSGNQFATEFTTNITVTLVDEFAPFLRPNQFVNFNENTLAVREASRIVAGATNNLRKVERIYDFVINNFTYDRVLAETVQSGYVPDLDRVWRARKGICFDYASLMTAMLRSQGVPTRLVIGYVGPVYHAWISVWTAESGWVDDVIFFNGRNWVLMDPTFAAGATSSRQLMDLIGDGRNHSARFFH